MAQGFNMKIEGLDNVLKNLNNLPKKLTTEIGGQLEEGAREIAQAAQRDAPGDRGGLHGGIGSFRVGPLTFEVVSRMDYSAYIEFGTGAKVQVPAGLEEFAAQFKGPASSGVDAKQAIYDWAKRKGIEEKFWWSIYIGIMTKGIAPHPFFFKNCLKEVPEMAREIKAILADL